MKKIVCSMMAGFVLACGAFAEKNWEVEIQGKLNAVNIYDAGDGNEVKFFDKNMFDDDTTIFFGYDDEKFEAGVEITPIYFATDENFDLSNPGTVNVWNAFSKLFAGVKFGETAKLRVGKSEIYTKDIVDGFQLDNFIDNKELGFLDDSFGNTSMDTDVAKESDNLKGLANLDFYVGPFTLQTSFSQDGFVNGGKNKFGAQARMMLNLDAADIVANYQFSETTDEKTELDHIASVYARLKMIECFPILVGAAYTKDTATDDSQAFSVELRCQRSFDAFGFGLHNNVTIKDGETIVYNGLGMAFPIAETVSLGAELENTIDIKDDAKKGLFVAYPFVAYSPAEDVLFKSGLKCGFNYLNDSNPVNLSIPLRVEVKF